VSKTRSKDRKARLAGHRKRLSQKWRAAGLCTVCGKPQASERVYCEECLARQRARCRKRRQQRKAARLCEKCGKPSAPGRTTCQACIAKRLERHRERPELQAWRDMKKRCLNPRHPSYSGYGDRSIRVCKRWRDSFGAFLADMGPRPSPKHSLDRFPDKDGNYEPGNCRWATWKEQGLNKRTNRYLELAGERLTLTEWAERTGVSVVTILQRLYRGWTVKKALTTPVRR
jgi:hypothetical protein